MKTYKNLTLLTLMMTTASCSQFLTHRDYLTEMEHDDSTFFKPREDFQVVSGDEGKAWETNTERRERTPASESDLQEDLGRRSLKQELRNLEGKLSENSLEFYEQYKHRLVTTSERIYFLKLTIREKKDYLASRGLLKKENQQVDSREQMYSQRQSQVITGMTKSAVMNNLGQPRSVEVAGNPSFENERWLYSVNGATRYIYFEAGRVQGWE